MCENIVLLNDHSVLLYVFVSRCFVSRVPRHLEAAGDRAASTERWASDCRVRGHGCACVAAAAEEQHEFTEPLAKPGGCERQWTTEDTRAKGDHTAGGETCFESTRV